MRAWFYDEATGEPMTACYLGPEFQLLAPGDILQIEDFRSKRPDKPCTEFMVEVLKLTYDRTYDPVGLSFTVRIIQ